MTANATSVEPMNPSMKNSNIAETIDAEATVKLDQAEQKCFWNGAEFALGDRVSVDGACYECSYGTWVLIDS